MMRTDSDTAGRPSVFRAGRQGRRPASRWKVIFVTLLVAGVLTTATWVLLGSRLLVVRHVEVTGTGLLPRDRVVAVAQIPLGSPMVALNATAARRRIEQLPQVEWVRVERDWPATVRIVVGERVPVALVAYGGRFAEIDRFGVTVVTAATRPIGLPDLVVAAPGPADPATQAALSAWRSLPGGFVRRLTSIQAATPESIVFTLTGGTTIVWGAAERAPEKLRLIDALTRTAAGRSVRTIDVSSPEVVTTQ